jgi:mRNA interferase MazF
MAITSQPSRTHGIGECLIEDWQEAGLLKPSSIKPAISTIEKSLVLKRLGKLSTKDFISMENALLQLLSLK